MCIPSHLEKSDLLDTSTDCLEATNTALDLQNHLARVENQLLAWYAELHKRTSPLFWTEVLPLRTTGSDTHHDRGHREGIVLFSNARIRYTLLLYWCALMLVYDTMVRLHPRLQRALCFCEGLLKQTRLSQPCADRAQRMQYPLEVRNALRSYSLTRKLEDLEIEADVLATLTVQAAEARAFYGEVQGLEIQEVLSPLWISMQFFQSRSPSKFQRCKAMFKWFSEHGFAMSAPLSSLSTRTFAEIGKQTVLDKVEV